MSLANWGTRLAVILAGLVWSSIQTGCVKSDAPEPVLKIDNQKPPVRTVTSDGPLLGVRPDGGAPPVSREDAGSKADAAPVDAKAPATDVASMAPDAAFSCGLIAQNCPNVNDACYPAATDGETECLSGGAVGEQGQCIEQSQCAKGLGCGVAEVGVAPLCLRLCHPQEKPCLPKSECQEWPDLAPYGFCKP